MKRRGFLKRLAGVATAAVVSERLIADDGVALNSMAHPQVTPGPPANGFSLAQLKPEGATIPYDLTEESLEQAVIDVHEHYRWVSSRRLFDFKRIAINPTEIEVQPGLDGDLYHLVRYQSPADPNIMDYSIVRDDDS